MKRAEQLASFIVEKSYSEISDLARQDLRIRVLDSVGCAIGALGEEPVRIVRAQLEDFGGSEQCTLIGGGRTAPDRASLYNAALVRYLDFNDSYLAKHETCHPSDNLGAILAAAEYADCHGREFMAALAIAYQVQCRLSEVAPVRAKGFDHTTQGAFAVAAGASKALALDQTKTVNALAIGGTAFNALRVTRTGELSNWKGLAYPNMAFGVIHSVFLAMRGITGPSEVFEGNKGFMDAIAGPFEIDWSREDLEVVRRTIIKKYNAEIHSQSAIEAILGLKHENPFLGADVERIIIETFRVAYNIIGGGEEGDKTLVLTKEQADHSLQYMVAVAALDGQVMPEQYREERVRSEDVQTLLRKISVIPTDDYSKRFPDEMPCRITVSLVNGEVLTKEISEYEGFHTRPMTWGTALRKFNELCRGKGDTSLLNEITQSIENLDAIRVRDLTRLLGRI
ncbi:MAG: MmgE/PrpD family protein [Desulfomonilaceae bacterium]